MTTIKLKNGSGAPATSDLVQGEPALDLTNKRLYTEDSGGTVIEVGTNPTSLTTGTFTSTGIDDNATSTKLTVADSAITTGSIDQLIVAHSTDGGGIRIDSTNSTNTGSLRFGDDLDNYIGALEYNHTNNAMSMYVNNATRMTIDSSGNMGIGSASNHAGARVVINDTPPTAFGSPMFQVGQETFTSSGMYSIGFGYTTGTYTEPPAEIAAVSTSASGGTTADIVFGTRSVTTNTAVTERMRIDSSGNVGIGTTSPSYKLEVVGQAQTDTLLVDTAGGVDSGFLGGRSDWTGGSTDNSFAVATYQANMCFFTNNHPTERMRIDSSGNLLVGVTSATAKLHVDHSSASTPTALFLNQSTASSGVGAVQTSIPSQSNNTNCYHFKGTTQGVASYFLYGNGTSSFTSDERQKKNVVNTRNGYLDDLKRLRVVDYHWNNQEDIEDKSVGLIAQEVEQVFPHLVIEHEMEGVGLRKNLRGSEFTFVLIKAIQEQQAMIEELKAEVAALKGK